MDTVANRDTSSSGGGRTNDGGGFSTESVDAFRRALSDDERALFDRSSVAADLLREVTEADAAHREESRTRRLAEALQPFIEGATQYASILDVFANSSELMSPIWGAIRLLLHAGREFGEYFVKLSDMLRELGEVLRRVPRLPALYPHNAALQKSAAAIYAALIEFCTRARHVFRVGEKMTEPSSSSQLRRSERLLPSSRVVSSLRNAVGLAAAVRLVWKPFKVQFGDIRNEIDKHVAEMVAEADLAEKEVVAAERRKNDTRWDGVERSQRQLADFIDDQNAMRVMEWLAPVNVDVNHSAASNLRHARSGEWFLQGEAFRTWLDAVEGEDNFLWLHAIPGAGKTVLASSIINYLESRRRLRGDAKTGLAYFYFDYKDTQKQDPAKMLSTVLARLGRQNREVFSEIEQFFKKQYSETSTFTASFDELLAGFEGFLGGHLESTVVVIDALDEAAPGSWDVLTEALKTLHKRCARLKLLVTSRNELAIMRAFEGLPEASIEQSDVAADIQEFVTSQIAKVVAEKRLKLRDPTLQLVVCNTLVSGSRGMFQWAQCQIDALCRLRNDKAIRAALTDLPRTLQDTYMRILQRVEDEGHPSDVEVVHRILDWLVRGLRDMTLDELSHAIAVDPDDKAATAMDLDAVDSDSEDVLGLLGGLVVVSAAPGGRKVITLAHFSVKEFLVSKDLQKAKPSFRVSKGDSEGRLASVCLTYLCYNDFGKPEEPNSPEMERRLERFPLLGYASESWAIHAQRSEVDGHQTQQLVDLTMKLFDTYEGGEGRQENGQIRQKQNKQKRGTWKRNFESWCRVLQHLGSTALSRPQPSRSNSNNTTNNARRDGARSIPRKRMHPLLCAARFGLTEAVGLLLQQAVEEHKKEKEDSEDGEFSEPASDPKLIISEAFHIAAARGYAGIIRRFLDIGHLPDLQLDLQKALYDSAARGHIGVAKLLLDRGAEVNTKGGKDGTALQVASLGGHAELVQLLIECGASRSACDKRYGTPLAAAAEKAHQQTCEVLLSHGADPNGRGGWLCHPLVSAIVGRNAAIVNRLLEAGADVHARGGLHCSAINAAASLGWDDMVRELAENRGARVNNPGSGQTDPLYEACLAGHESTARLLIETLGANANARGGRHRNPLGAASAEGHLAVVKLLIASGADTSYWDRTWGDALQAAAARGHGDEVRALAAAGMSAENEASLKNDQALIAASSAGHDHILRILWDELGVAAGDTPEMVTALMAAAYDGHVSTARLLVERGADVNGLNEGSSVHSRYYCTPLEAAAYRNNLEVVEALLALGADAGPDAIDTSYFGSAINAAVAGGNTVWTQPIVEALLAAGADVNQSTPEAGLVPFALHHAVSSCDLETTRLLLDLGADLNMVVDGHWSCLMWAASWDEDEGGEADQMFDLLVEHGADVTLTVACDDPGDEDVLGGLDKDACCSPLQAAAFFGQCGRMRKLVELGAPLAERYEDDDDDDTLPFASALQAAAFRGQLEAMNVLLDLGADADLVGGIFGTALQAAASEGRYAAVKLLLDAGANPKRNNVGFYGSALMALCRGDWGERDDDGDDENENGNEGGDNDDDDGNGNDSNGENSEQKHEEGYEGDGENDDSESSIVVEEASEEDGEGGRVGSRLYEIIEEEPDDSSRQDESTDNNNEEDWEDEKSEDNEDEDGTSTANSNPDSTGGGESNSGSISRIARLLVRHGADVNARTFAAGSPITKVLYPLAAACLRTDDFADSDSARLIATLLDLGADVNASGGELCNALQAAAHSSNQATVRRLLEEHGADPNIAGGFYHTPLAAAYRGGQVDSILALYQAGADNTLVGGYARAGSAMGFGLGYPIVTTTTMNNDRDDDDEDGNNDNNGNDDYDDGHTGCCQTLIHQLLRRWHFDPNLPYGRYGHALQNAAVVMHRRDDASFRYILDAGAEINAVGGWYGTALAAVIAHWDSDDASLSREYMAELLNRGADPMLGNERFPNAAAAAVWAGERGALDALVELIAGADGGEEKKPISKSRERERALLLGGDQQNGEKTRTSIYGTTLQLAACSPYRSVRLSLLRRVLRAGARLNPAEPCGRFGTPLQAAIVNSGGSDEVVRFLVGRGADVRSKGGRHGGVLTAAALCCPVDVVEMLLRRGADPDERGSVYGSPLQAACARGDIRAVMALLRAGADVNVNRGRYGTALQAACTGGFETIARLLVERGAEVNIVPPRGKYKTALMAAAMGGHERLARWLVEEAGAEILDGENGSVVDRKWIARKGELFDDADDLLERIQRPPEEEEEEEWQDEDEGEEGENDADETEETVVDKVENPDEDGKREGSDKKEEEEKEDDTAAQEDDKFLPWNAESIPDYNNKRMSRWDAIRNMSLHALRHSSIQADALRGLFGGAVAGSRASADASTGGSGGRQRAESAPGGGVAGSSRPRPESAPVSTWTRIGEATTFATPSPGPGRVRAGTEGQEAKVGGEGGNKEGEEREESWLDKIRI